MQIFRVILYKIHIHKVQHPYHEKPWKNKIINNFFVQLLAI